MKSKFEKIYLLFLIAMIVNAFITLYSLIFGFTTFTIIWLSVIYCISFIAALKHIKENPSGDLVGRILLVVCPMINTFCLAIEADTLYAEVMGLPKYYEMDQ